MGFSFHASPYKFDSLEMLFPLSRYYYFDLRDLAHFSFPFTFLDGMVIKLLFVFICAYDLVRFLKHRSFE